MSETGYIQSMARVWVCCYERDVWPNYSGRTRRQAIDNLILARGLGETWKELREQGFRVEKATVVPGWL